MLVAASNPTIWGEPAPFFVLGVVTANAAMLVGLAVWAFRTTSDLRRLHRRLESQHTLTSHVGTIEGLIESMALQLETAGGMAPETRAKMYAAIREQFGLYHEAAGIQRPELPWGRELAGGPRKTIGRGNDAAPNLAEASSQRSR